jgi:hypothetical protein
MRSAWSPTRSMSLDTFFEASPNCLLALPTVLATDFASRSARPPLRIERGSGTPRTFLGRVRLLSTKPPATPAAPAPMATAGPPALLAAFLSKSTRPLVFWLVLLRPLLAPPLEFDLLRLWERRFAPLPLEPAEPLLEREALLRLRVDALLRLRVEADDFERDEPPGERDEPLRLVAPPERDDPLALGFEREPSDELLFLCPPRDADLLLAIPHPFSQRVPASFREYPSFGAITQERIVCKERR